MKPGFVVQLEMDIVEENLAETRVLDLTEVGEYIHRSSPLPMMAEERGNNVFVDVIGQHRGRGNDKLGGSARGVEPIDGFSLGRGGFGGVGWGLGARTRNTLTERANGTPRNAGRLEVRSADRHGDVVHQRVIRRIRDVGIRNE